MNERILRHFARFSIKQLRSGDIDPMYPVLRTIFQGEGLPREVALWRLFLYVTWYDVCSAERVWRAHPTPGELPELRLPTGVERRSFRGNAKASEHVNALMNGVVRVYGSIGAWVDEAVGGGGEDGWQRVRAAYQTLPYGGEWSSYKWADLLKHVAGVPITANDIGVGGGSATAGPVPGMVLVTGRYWARCARDVGLQKDLLAECIRLGVPFDGLDQLETCLCDFNSLAKGRYYVGNDIDVQQEQLNKVAASAHFWAARRASFPEEYLGELRGWSGPRPELRARYLTTGEI